jgi:dTDP-4-dehydrorhamnose 3,5-epimerase
VLIDKFNLEGPFTFVPQIFEDDRGYFCETFNLAELRETGVRETDWVQDNESLSKNIYTLRGMHFQLSPFSQAKIIRVLRGKIFDVIIDLRQGSKTFAEWLGFELDAKSGKQLYVPVGFAHGFLTLEPDCLVVYKVSAHFSKAHDRSLLWSDAEIGIVWPLPHGVSPVLSEKDATASGFQKMKHELESLK